ncbi:MAG TPA: cytochrome c, partial [Luteolibacter sp.]|nr:cytochrome c [Luteolibacter sp.]
MPDIRQLRATSLLRILGGWMLLACIGGAQQLFPPSRTVEQTRVPVFSNFSPDDKSQQITHSEALANFRLVMEYRLEKPGDRLALELGPSTTMELPAAPDGGWRTLQLRHELTGRRKGVFEATVDGRIVKQSSLPPPDGVQPAATFPDGVPGIPVRVTLHAAGNARIRSAWVQPLSQVEHAKHISSWNDKSLDEGRKIYESLCITCHGTMTKEGSLPTSLRFGKQPFKNGSDPFRMYQTISKGYGQMTPMPQYTAAQTYAVIQHIRETFLAPHRPEDMTAVDDSYLASLPVPMTTLRRESAGERPPPFYHRMDFGPALHWTYQIERGNIAFKALATRLDPGPGGIIRGNAWIVHDLDTLAVAAVTGGSFVDWRGIAFDGTHGTHTSLTGKKLFANPVGPGWANPKDGSWDDPRPLARDGRPYGPLPREWARHLGTHVYGPEQI